MHLPASRGWRLRSWHPRKTELIVTNEWQRVMIMWSTTRTNYKNRICTFFDTLRCMVFMILDHHWTKMNSGRIRKCRFHVRIWPNYHRYLTETFFNKHKISNFVSDWENSRFKEASKGTFRIRTCHHNLMYRTIDTVVFLGYFSIRLASLLVGAPNFWSGGYEFESPAWIELGDLTERSFHNTVPYAVASCKTPYSYFYNH
jgi:hypothetical protein